MFKIITPIAFVLLAVSASEEESIEVTRGMLGEDYNNDGIPDVYQSNYQKGYDIDRNYGHRYDYDKYRPNDDYNNDKEYNKGWSNNDDKNDYGRYGATQGRQDDGHDVPDSKNGLESRYGGYGHGNHNDYYKRDYYHKPYYPRYWANEGGQSDNDASRVLGVQDNDEAGDDNRLILASRYGGGYNNGYKRNYNRYNYYNDDHYGPYWANEAGNPDDAGSRFTVMDKEAGDDNALASRYGGYGRNDYYRYDRYYRNKYNDDGYRYWSTQGGEPDKTDRDGGLESRYGRYGRNNNYYNGYDRYYRNRYNDGYRYWSTQGGQDGKNDIDDGYDAGLASRYGHGNNYYNGWYKRKDDYYNGPNYGHYWANERGNNEGKNQDLIDLGQANVILKSDDGVFEFGDDNEKDDNEDD